MYILGRLNYPFPVSHMCTKTINLLTPAAAASFAATSMCKAILGIRQPAATAAVASAAAASTAILRCNTILGTKKPNAAVIADAAAVLLPLQQLLLLPLLRCCYGKGLWPAHRRTLQ